MVEENLGLTGKQKLIYEAFQKINTGERLIKEGKIELNNLIPDTKEVTSKSKAPGLFRKNGYSEKIIRQMTSW